MLHYTSRKIIRRLPGIVIKSVPLPEPKIIEGFGAREKTGEICKTENYRKCLLVTDQTLFSLGFHRKIVDSLEKSGVACRVFSEIRSEPNVPTINAGIKAALDFSADCIVALGGGSVLDTSKMIAAGAKMKARNASVLLLKFLFVQGRTLPMISIPSTAGTGAEITVGAIVTKPGKDVKCATVIVGLNIPYVISDTELTINAPKSVTVSCGIDALSHGLEGVVSATISSEEDMKKSMECVRFVFENLPILMNEPRNETARLKMCRAAYYGGNAINKQLAGYIHAFAHSIGAEFHLPHGNAIALSTVPVIRFERRGCEEKLAELSEYCGFSKKGDDVGQAADKFISALEKLISDCGFPPLPDDFTKEKYPLLVKRIIADSINYSAPVVMKEEDIPTVLDEIQKIGR